MERNNKNDSAVREFQFFFFFFRILLHVQDLDNSRNIGAAIKSFFSSSNRVRFNLGGQLINRFRHRGAARVAKERKNTRTVFHLRPMCYSFLFPVVPFKVLAKSKPWLFGKNNLFHNRS